MRGRGSLLLLVMVAFSCSGKGNPDGNAPGEFAFRAIVPRVQRNVTGPVDAVMVVPHRRGRPEPRQIAIVPVAADGSFEATLWGDFSFTMFLIDTTVPPAERVRGTVSLGLDTGTLLAIDATSVTGNINAGDLQARTNEAVTDTSTADLAQWFDLSAELLDGIGVADDLLEGLRNIATNYNLTGERWISADVRWYLREDIEALRVDERPPPTALAGASINFEFHKDSRIDPVALQDGAQIAVLVPPAQVVLNGQTYGPDAPLPMSAVNAAGDSVYIAFEAASAGFDAATLDGQDSAPEATTAQGLWTVRVDGEDLGWFDLASLEPRDETGLPVGVYPVPKLTFDGDQVSRVDISWRARDRDGNDTAIDQAVVDRMMTSSAIALEGWRSSGGAVFSDVVAQEVSGNLESGGIPTTLAADHPYLLGPTHTLIDLAPGDLYLRWLSVASNFGMTTIDFGWGMECHDQDQDSQLTCMGDFDDLDPRSWRGAPEICGDGIDNDGMDGDPACRFDVAWGGDGVLPLVDDPEVLAPSSLVPTRWRLIGNQEAGIPHAPYVQLTHGRQCGVELSALDGPQGLPAMAPGEEVLWPLVTVYPGCWDGGIYVPIEASFPARGLIAVDLSSDEVEWHDHAFTVVRGTPLAANTVTSVTFPSIPAVVGGQGTMVVTGALQTEGRIGVEPLPSVDWVTMGHVVPIDISLELRDSNGDLATGLCADPGCTEPIANPAIGHWVVYAPPGTYSYTATVSLRWDVETPWQMPARPLVWTTDALGEHRHNPLDAAWQALPLVPAVTGTLPMMTLAAQLRDNLTVVSGTSTPGISTLPGSILCD